MLGFCLPSSARIIHVVCAANEISEGQTYPLTPSFAVDLERNTVDDIPASISYRSISWDEMVPMRGQKQRLLWHFSIDRATRRYQGYIDPKPNYIGPRDGIAGYCNMGQ
jgi:hypothetical protein